MYVKNYVKLIIYVIPKGIQFTDSCLLIGSLIDVATAPTYTVFIIIHWSMANVNSVEKHFLEKLT